MNKWMNEWMNEWINKWMNEWMNEWKNERTNEWINERTNKWMNALKNERMDEWTNEWMFALFGSLGTTSYRTSNSMLLIATAMEPRNSVPTFLYEQAVLKLQCY